MKIEFIFNSIKDIENLYEIKNMELPFGCSYYIDYKE